MVQVMDKIRESSSSINISLLFSLDENKTLQIISKLLPETILGINDLMKFFTKNRLPK